jgi:hypothetical protein
LLRVANPVLEQILDFYEQDALNFAQILPKRPVFSTLRKITLGGTMATLRPVFSSY